MNDETKPERKLWLCIDPGITTGWAVLDARGEVRGTSVWGTGEIAESLDAVIREAHRAGYEVTAVIERMPNVGGLGPVAEKLERVRRTIAEIVNGVYELKTTHILPGEWKSSRVAKTTKTPHAYKGALLMTHQKDAIRMGRYAIEKEKK